MRREGKTQQTIYITSEKRENKRYQPFAYCMIIFYCYSFIILFRWIWRLRTIGTNILSHFRLNAILLLNVFSKFYATNAIFSFDRYKCCTEIRLHLKYDRRERRLIHTHKMKMTACVAIPVEIWNQWNIQNKKRFYSNWRLKSWNEHGYSIGFTFQPFHIFFSCVFGKMTWNFQWIS